MAVIGETLHTVGTEAYNGIGFATIDGAACRVSAFAVEPDSGRFRPNEVLDAGAVDYLYLVSHAAGVQPRLDRAKWIDRRSQPGPGRLQSTYQVAP